MMKGQGTIEYLVILAVIVVISLVVVSLMASSAQPAQGISEGVSKLGTRSSSISVVDSTMSPDGSVYLKLKNQTGESIEIEKIFVEGEEASPDAVIGANSEQGFIIPTSLVCTKGTASTMRIELQFSRGEYGLPGFEDYGGKIIVNCETAAITDPSAINAAEGNGIAFPPGSPENPIPITTIQELDAIRNDLNLFYRLEADLDLSTATRSGGEFWNNGEGWEPIGAFCHYPEPDCSFTGGFDGQYHTISGMFIDRANYAGLFGSIRSTGTCSDPTCTEYMDCMMPVALGGCEGTWIFDYSTGIVENLNLTGVDITTSSYRTGPIAGISYGTVKNVYTQGTVSGGGDSTGGIVGHNDQGSIIQNSHSDVTLSSPYTGGGIAGQSYGRIENCYATGSVSGGPSRGGIAGWSSGGTIQNSYSTAAISGADQVGGIVSTGGAVINSFATGSISSSYPITAGGVVGVSASISNCYWFNNEDTCYGTGNTGCPTAGPEASVDVFYDLTHPVYVGGTTSWDFGNPDADANWSNICDKVGYPPLMWEEITDSADCRID